MSPPGRAVRADAAPTAPTPAPATTPPPTKTNEARTDPMARRKGPAPDPRYPRSFNEWDAIVRERPFTGRGWAA